MKNINILFLGASKRTSLLERFNAAALELGVKLKMYSCEINDDFCPISHLAQILVGPKFSDSSFLSWLDNTIKGEKINIVIPNMDQATVALAKYNEHYNNSNCWCVISSYDLCKKMNDKILADEFFKENNISTFENTEFYPKIIKERFGFGAKGQYIVNNKMEYNLLSKKISIKNYIVQDYRKGKESTVDIYISKKHDLIGYVVRDRVLVSDGEVMNCTTRIPEYRERELIEKLAKYSWVGCITLQYITYPDKSLKVVEISPRFGGGATCAIECGLNMPKYVIQEFLGERIDIPDIKQLKMVRARRDFFHEI